MSKIFAAVAVALALLSACARLPGTNYSAPAIPRYSLNTPFYFGGLAFEVKSATYAPSYTNSFNQVTRAGDAFFIIEVEVANKTGGPLPIHFQPIFQLLDPSGAVYERDEMHTIGINMNKPGRGSYGQPWNPNTPIRQEVVFEVPKRPYTMRVIVPERARVGFAGNVTSYGPVFLVDLAAASSGAPTPIAEDGRYRQGNCRWVTSSQYSCN
jgi:hypothetical protein